MTSMTKLRRELAKWTTFADRVTPGWSIPATRVDPDRPDAPAGLLRAWHRHDREQLRRNVLLWKRAQMEKEQ
ncbi:MAG TPA: hypothetical protein VK899_03915 [Gemmatimonadales bacterium]|nr:hypothetical protein [Gemmatimonadales bacterium]